MKITNGRFKVSKGGFNNIRVIRIEERSYLKGTVTTPHGIVGCYAQGDLKCYSSSHLDFVFEGFHYTRRFKKRYTARGLHTKAMQFALEVTTQGRSLCVSEKRVL